MTDITTKPNHGEQLVSKDGKARNSLQIYLDEITLILNEDRTSLKPYTVATLPSAGDGYGLIMVTDETGGPVPAFSDLSNWLRVTDRAVVS